MSAIRDSDTLLNIQQPLKLYPPARVVVMLSVCAPVCVFEVRLWSKLWSPTPAVCPSGRHFPLTFNSCTRLLITDMLVSLVGRGRFHDDGRARRTCAPETLRWLSGKRRASIFLAECFRKEKVSGMYCVFFIIRRWWMESCVVESELARKSPKTKYRPNSGGESWNILNCTFYQPF